MRFNFGFWQVCRRPAAACAQRAACGRKLPNRLARSALGSAAVLVIVAIVYPYVIPHLL